MSATARASNRSLHPRAGVPRWAVALMVLLALVAVVAVAVAVFAPRGQESLGAPAPEPIAPPATRVPFEDAEVPTPTATTPAPADGCLGGQGELDQAVLAAQQDAPLTETGAAAFAATVIRWAFNGPPPPYQQVTAEQVLTGDATSAAKSSLSSSKDLEGSSGSFDFSQGRYYVEAYDGRSAIVSYLAGSDVSQNGVLQGSVIVSGAVHLEAINGVWRYSDLSDERSLDDLQRIGIPYVGGC